jgi:hypothetical protein
MNSHGAPRTLDSIKRSLVALRMPRALEVLDATFRRIEQGEIDGIEALDQLLVEELTVRENRRVSTALKMSRLTAIKTLAGFDFSFQPSLDRHRIMALAELNFIERAEVVHLLGPPVRARAILRRRSPSRRSKLAEVSSSPLSPISSPRSPRPNARGPCVSASDIYPAPRSLSSMRLAICLSSQVAAICSSSSSMPDTKRAR